MHFNNLLLSLKLRDLKLKILYPFLCFGLLFFEHFLLLLQSLFKTLLDLVDILSMLFFGSHELLTLDVEMLILQF